MRNAVLLLQLLGEGPAYQQLTDLAERSGLSPVSYTHLRAHETVLDLVCRLLLEKKKKPPQVRSASNRKHSSAKHAHVDMYALCTMQLLTTD